jgi:hypothetical protein
LNVNTEPYKVNFKRLVYKNAINPQKGDPSSNFSLKPLPPKGQLQKFGLPPPLDFQPVCIYDRNIYLTCTQRHVWAVFYVDRFQIVAADSGIVAFADDLLDPPSGANQTADKVVAGS